MKTNFFNIFKEDNNLNEKNIIGFISFCIMVIIAISDVIAGFMGNTLEINRFVFMAFVWVTLGSFGISEVSKTFKGTNQNQLRRPNPKRNNNKSK